MIVTGLLRKTVAVARGFGMGEFLFTPLGLDDRILAEVGFTEVTAEDLTESGARVARAWHAARARRRAELDRIEGVEENAAMQRFLDTVATLAQERRLSRLGYRARKPGEGNGPAGIRTRV